MYLDSKTKRIMQYEVSPLCLDCNLEGIFGIACLGRNLGFYSEN